MPLNSGCSKSAFRNNISKLIDEGMPRDQAVAAAFDKLRSSCKKQGKSMPDVGEIVPPGLSTDETIEAIETVLDDAQPCCGYTTAAWGIFDYKKGLK